MCSPRNLSLVSRCVHAARNNPTSQILIQSHTAEETLLCPSVDKGWNYRCSRWAASIVLLHRWSAVAAVNRAREFTARGKRESEGIPDERLSQVDGIAQTKISLSPDKGTTINHHHRRISAGRAYGSRRKRGIDSRSRNRRRTRGEQDEERASPCGGRGRSMRN